VRSASKVALKGTVRKSKPAKAELRHIPWSSVEVEALNPLLGRHFVVGQNVMLARVLLKKGCIVPEHSHHNEQITYVLEGALRFGIDGKEIVVNAGEVLTIPPNMPHWAEALADTLDLDIFNHKESPIILSEMERATKFAAEKLAMIEPGLGRVREKLYLASKRQTTREEDVAYSLFGIFNVSLPVVYGEGNQAVGRLLEHILTCSDNVTILAWVGTSGGHHSYLPSNLTVYDQILPPHVPQPIENTKMDRMVADLRSFFPDPSLIIMLYERLLDLPSLSIVSGRLRLPVLLFCLAGGLTQLVARNSDSSLHVYRVKAPILGEVQFETKDDSLGTQRLVLVHPWISPLLDEDFSCGNPLFDLDARALRILVRLRQPFGALLLASQERGQYRRVATDSFIRVQIGEETPLKELMASIGTVDVQ